MVRARRFASPEEAVEAALSLIAANEAAVDAAALPATPELRAKVAEGLAAARAGDLSDGDEFFAELERDDAAADPSGPEQA